MAGATVLDASVLIAHLDAVLTFDQRLSTAAERLGHGWDSSEYEA